MRYFYTATILLAGIITNAQTIDSSDVLIMESRIVQKYDTTVSSLDPGNTGTGQTWDFSSLDDHGQDVYIVNAPGDKAGASDFPDANRSLFIFEEDSSFQFFRVTSSQVVSSGFSEIVPGGMIITQDLGLEMLDFPVTMGDKLDQNIAGIDSAFFVGIDPDSIGPHPTVDSIRIKSDFSMSAEIDAQGTMTTPFGSFSAFRQYIEFTTSDSTLMYANGSWQPISTLIQLILGFDAGDVEVEYSYRWWSEGSSMPLVEGAFDPVNDEFIDEVFWLAELVIGLDETTTNVKELKVFPNPSTGIFHVEIPEMLNGTLHLFDLSGREMLQQSATPNLNIIDASSLETGVYVLLLKDQNGTILGNQKLQVY